jgi:uncharacterized membrane protein YraQ (UPF0718 family)
MTLNPSQAPVSRDAPRTWLTISVFVLVVLGGLSYVKWIPYVHKAQLAADTHAIGKSLLMGTASAPPDASLDAAMAYALAYGKAIWQAMVLGLLVGSGIQALLPVGFIARWLGQRGWRGIVLAGIVAVPGMMCTCCAAPVVNGLRRAQASTGAAAAFWLGNTLLNPATLIFMGFVLGWHWSALRLVVGATLVFGLGLALDRWYPAPIDTHPIEPISPVSAAGNVWLRWARILGSMAVRLLPEYLIIVLFLGAARAWLFPAVGPHIGNDLVWVLAFALAGAAFVIPTAGEIPIVQAMLALGVGVAPAAALLLTLPPISLPSLAMVAKVFPRRALGAVCAAVVLAGISAAGMAVALGF